MTHGVKTDFKYCVSLNKSMERVVILQHSSITGTPEIPSELHHYSNFDKIYYFHKIPYMYVLGESNDQGRVYLPIYITYIKHIDSAHHVLYA